MKKITLLFSFIIAFSYSKAATITTVGSGNWNSIALNAPWPLGVGPAAGDNVVIANGNTVNLTSSQTIVNVTLNGTGILNMNTAGKTLTVNGNFTMNGTSKINGNSTTAVIAVVGTFTVSGGADCVVQNIALGVLGTTTIAGTLTQNNGSSAVKGFVDLTITGTWTNTASNVPIFIAGNMINNGTFTQGTGRVNFIGATSNTVTGSAASTAFGGGITVTKGIAGTSADQSNIIDIQCVITISNGGLILNNGTFKLSSASTIVPFTSDPNIPVSAKLWNNGGTMNQTSGFDWTLDGYLKVSAGTINFGGAISNRIIPTTTTANTGTVEITGGALNCTGRISNGTTGWTFIMSGGTLTLGTIGNSVSGKDPFNMDNSACSFSMSGGTMIIERSNTNAGENLGYHNYGTVGTGFTGGTLQIGDASTPAGNIMRIETDIPIYNLVIFNANTTAQLQSELVAPLTTQIVVTNNVTITDGVLDASNQNFLIGGNYTNNSSIADPFTEGTKLVTFNGTAAQTISNTGNANGTKFYDVTLNNTFATSPQITLSTNVTIQHTFTMTLGKVNLNSNVLTLGTGNTVALAGTLSYTAGWLYGGTFTRWFSTGTVALANARGHFPMGTSSSNTKDYRPLWVTYSGTALSSGGTVSVIHNPVYPSWHTNVAYNDATWAGGTTLQGISNSSWVISTANGFAFGGVGNNTGELRFGGTGFNTFVLTDLNASLAASAVGTFGAATSVNTALEVNRTAITAAMINNTWYIGTKNVNQSPLPIELLSFTADPTIHTVELNWSTATETNNDFFTIEKSNDARNFTQVGILDGAGNSIHTLNYHSSDEDPFNGLSYYRLKQTDLDGQFTYSNIIAVNFDQSDFAFNVFPNPSDGSNINFSFNSSANKEVLVVVFDAQGKEDFSRVIITDKNGESVYAFDPTEKLSSGIYLITASADNNIYRKKLIIR